MTIVFRVDADESIGRGHLARCLSLAEAGARAGHEIVFAMTASSDKAAADVRARGLRCEVIAAPRGSSDDARLTKDVGDGLVIVDGYAFGPAFLEALAPRFVCYVDDLGDGRYPCAAVLNHNFYAESLALDAPDTCLRLLGPRYGIVADAFVAARARASSAVPERARKILVTYGGSDPTHETDKALDALARVAGPLEVRVVVGALCPRVDAIRAKAALMPHPTEVAFAVSDMAERMLDTELAITAGGVTCMELACLGVPAIVTFVADNQRLVVGAVEERGLMRGLGAASAIDAGGLAFEIRALCMDRARRGAMVERQRGTVDGLGKDRVIEELGRAMRSRAPR